MSEMPSGDLGHIEIGERADGQWRWSWYPTEGEPLVGTYLFSSYDEAKEEAVEAYPGVPVRPAPEHHAVSPRIRKTLGGWVVVLLASGAVAVAGAAVSRVARRRTRSAADRSGRPRS